MAGMPFYAAFTEGPINIFYYVGFIPTLLVLLPASYAASYGAIGLIEKYWPKPTVRNPFQFSFLNFAIAIFLMSVGFASWQFEPPKISTSFHGFADLVYLSGRCIQFVFFPAAIGMLAGRPILGLNVGFALYWWWTVYICWAIGTYGMT